MAGDKDNKTYSLEEIMSETYESDEVFSLESILAEYKSSAFIDGEKKTPPDELEDKVNEIFKEITGKTPPKAAEPSAVAEEDPEKAWTGIFEEKKSVQAKAAPEPEKPRVKQEAAEAQKVKSIDDFRTQAETVKEAPVSVGTKPERKENTRANEVSGIFEDSIDDDDARYFESREFADKVSGQVDSQDDWQPPVLDFDDVEDDPEYEEEPAPSLFGRLFSKKHREEYDEEYDEYEEESDVPDEEPEPDIESETVRFSAPIRSLTLRSYGAAILCVVMFILTHLFEADKALPFGIGYNAAAAGGAVLIMQLVVMMLGLDVLISGAEDLFRAEPGAESLVLISCVVTTIDGFSMLIRKDFTAGLPFSIVAASSLFFAMRARRSYYAAMRDSLKMSQASASPYGVISESESIEGREILKKVQSKTEGFYNNLVSQDIGESVYSRVTPLLILASFVFAFLSSVGRGSGQNFAHCFAIMTSISAAFPAAAVFSLPFHYVAAKIKKTGCALAGWGGACDVYDADGALITDEDVFPAGSVSLSGIKFFEGMNQRKAIVYASSLIITSGSGLSRIFSELLRSQGYTTKKVEAFSCYEGGGIGGVIDGERVLVGSGAFMNLMGIRVPDKVNISNTVFVAVNDGLAAVFTVNYVPANSVQSALVSLLDTKINILLAVRDFNVTPNVIQQKFKVSMEGVEYIPVETSYRLSQNAEVKSTGAAAILCREGLAPLAEIITRGRLVKLVTELNTIISIGGTVIGLLLMFFLCWTASFSSASAENTFIFMLAVEICVLLLSQIVKKRQ